MTELADRINEMASQPNPRTQPPLASARIVERRAVHADLWIIKLQPSIPFAFKPGQYCTIGVDGIERPYSIVSAPQEPALELFSELVPEARRRADAPALPSP